MNSILSYKERGPYGKSSYRGNCTGLIIKDLSTHFKPNTFIDVCEGSGTSRHVCQELGINYHGLDLHSGFDFTKHSVLEKTMEHGDIVFSHPPYFDMVNYAAQRYKHNLTVIDGNDTSLCASVDQFLEMSQVMLYNQREATRQGKVYSTLIGDYRKNGRFYSFQSDFISMMPKSELLSVAIKLQHNQKSSFKAYKGNFIPIHHEYLIIWKKASTALVQVIWDKAFELKRQVSATWRTLVRLSLMKLGNKASLQQIYSEVEAIAADKISGNPHYKAKIRQTLQYHFTAVERGVWAL